MMQEILNKYSLMVHDFRPRWIDTPLSRYNIDGSNVYDVNYVRLVWTEDSHCVNYTIKLNNFNDAIFVRTWSIGTFWFFSERLAH